MDLRRYLESEGEEERELGYAAAGAAASPAADGYPGDPDVRVPDSEVTVERRLLQGDGFDLSIKRGHRVL